MVTIHILRISGINKILIKQKCKLLRCRAVSFQSQYFPKGIEDNVLGGNQYSIYLFDKRLDDFFLLMNDLNRPRTRQTGFYLLSTFY